MLCWSHWPRGWSLAVGLLLSACEMIQPNGSSGAYERGVSAYQAGRYGLAIQELGVAVGQNPTSVPALNVLGAAYDHVGRYDLAQRQYQKALALDPTSSQTLNNIGFSYLLQDRPDVAAVYLREAWQYETDGAALKTVAANADAAERGITDVKPAREPVTTAPRRSAEAPSSRIRRLTSKVQSIRTKPEPPVTDASELEVPARTEDQVDREPSDRTVRLSRDLLVSLFQIARIMGRHGDAEVDELFADFATRLMLLAMSVNLDTTPGPDADAAGQASHAPNAGDRMNLAQGSELVRLLARLARLEAEVAPELDTSLD